jgi:hypothetical protein
VQYLHLAAWLEYDVAALQLQHCCIDNSAARPDSVCASVCSCPPPLYCAGLMWWDMASLCCAACRTFWCLMSHPGLCGSCWEGCCVRHPHMMWQQRRGRRCVACVSDTSAGCFLKHFDRP